jgi:SAM-dependent methyltransferase
MTALIQDLRTLLPKALRRWLVRKSRLPRVGALDLGDLRRLRPVSKAWGWDRGLPVDRFYIEQFLAPRAGAMHGRVLEIGDNEYTLRYGASRVEQRDVLHAAEGNPKASFVADLSDAPQVPSDAFDCIICTQTIHVIPDTRAAVRTLHRVLKPGGTLLATLPGVSRIYHDEHGPWADYWRFTSHSARWLFEQCFEPGEIEIVTFGNVLTASAFLFGLAAEELTAEELNYHDELYQVLIGVRATRGPLPPDRHGA